MKKMARMIGMFISILLFCCFMHGSAFAGSWQSDGTNWRYLDDTGNYAANIWIQDGGYYYYVDAQGVMKLGWHQDPLDGQWYYLQPNVGGPQGSMKTGWLQDIDGHWYFLDTRVGGPYGSMKIGWQWIDGRCYYFDPAQGGAMLANTVTPDGDMEVLSGGAEIKGGAMYIRGTFDAEVDIMLKAK